MSHPSQQPAPPLPPRSPRPPVTGFAPSPQYPGPSFPPPPRRLPPRSTGASLSPVGPPPLPPRPSGYEIRTPSNPATPFNYSPSIFDAPSTYNGQAGSHFPLPPPPPGPPPPYSAPVVDIYSTHYPTYSGGTESGAAPPVSLSAVLGASPNVLRTFPPPPPAPPPQTSPYLSPGISHHSPVPSRSLSAASHPASQPSSRPAQHEDVRLGTGQVHDNDIHVGTTSDENPPVYQPPNINAGECYGASDSYLPEKAPEASHAYSVPSLVASSTEVSNFRAEPSASSTAPSQQPLEASFQSLHLNSVPPVPPKAPLAPNSAQNQLNESTASTPGRFLAYNPYTSQSQAYPSHEHPGNTDVPVHHVHPKSYSFPPQDEVLPKPQAVTQCIDNLMTFPTDWYYHPEAPDYLICSRCYVDRIHGSRYQEAYHHRRFNDGKPRICRFGKPRMRDQLYKEALASGSLRPVVDWMQKRSTILDCKGVDGVKGKFADGIVWYKARDILRFLSCQACYEDQVLTNQFAQHFSVHDEAQRPDDVWACDMAVPYIEREYNKRAKQNDWQGFVVEAKARITAQPCPQGKKVPGPERKWFAPREAGLQDLVLCSACYRDQVIHTGEESKWGVRQDLTREYLVCCSRGIHNTLVLFNQALATKNNARFWDAARKYVREKDCDDEGIVDGVWYTLPSRAREFGVCGACYAGMLEPLGLSRFWVLKTDVPPGAKVLCCFNFNHPRFSKYLPLFAQMDLTLDPAPLDEYASVYASIPVCMRDEDKPNLHWYGWRDCTICPECYLEFARHSPLANLMEYHDTQVVGSTMCEIYSPRMRKLYTECGSTNPPNVQALLEHSSQRRQVYTETVPQIRMMMFQARMQLQRQKMLNTMSSHYTMMGQLDQITHVSSYTYSAPGIGYSFANADLLQGAAYGQQAMGIMANIGSGGLALAVQQLEQRWRAVE